MATRSQRTTSQRPRRQPGPVHAAGTNTWLVGRDPCWVVDPGPGARRAPSSAVLAERRARRDRRHRADPRPRATTRRRSPTCARRRGAAARRRRAPRRPTSALADGDTFGPLTVVATPGHAPDHLAFVAGGACFTGDAVLGEGSVFVAPDPGSLRGYLAALERLRRWTSRSSARATARSSSTRTRSSTSTSPTASTASAGSCARSTRGLRTTDELLDRVWADAPAALRGAATVTLAAHLDKLDEEGRLPDGVERPQLSGYGQV